MPPARTSSPVALAVTGVVGFLVLGALASVLGPTLPDLRSQHGLGAGSASLLPAAFSGGSALGVGAAGLLRGRRSVAELMTTGALALALGCAAVPVAPGGAAAGACLLLAGLGFGMLDLLLNLTLARSFGSGSGAVLMAVSAAFGVSAVVTPVAVGWFPERLAPPYWACAVGGLVLAALTTRLRVATTPVQRSRHTSSCPGELLVVLLLAAVLLGYVAVEGGAAGWETTHLRAATDLSAGRAAQAVALFWLGLTVGRLLAAPLALRHHPSRLVIGSMAAATVALALATHGPLAVPAYALAGLLLAPVFPAVIAWHAGEAPGGRGATLVFAVGLAGPLAASPLIGIVVEATDARAVPWVLAGVAATTAGVAVVLARRTASRRA
ncbi:hypothetical protein [Modestobacter sp. NPDC049651]|uniref:MFS transporter n=1 Tax=unclassified Modestobacter TaxID=2643866 RepID=UPI0033FF78A5